jgi:beta-lactam-binding protein with PASTA domain
MDTTLSPPTGVLLDGRYLVESQLARGGMATVYLGRDTRLGRVVALKIAHPDLAADHEFVHRFISEARAVAQLSSPNVVSVFDQGSAGDIHFIAMEYVPGQTLRELLITRGRLSPREALDITERVLAGLAAAHAAGVIHRDVKPENVLLGVDGAVKVADFGLARAAAGVARTKSGMIIGTAAYLAPEQVARSESDARTDVYAVGVMLFELLTGTQPHTGDTPLAVAYKHVNDVVPAPSSVVPTLPPALDALVALATSRDADQRPADAGQFLHAIQDVRRGLPLSANYRRGQHAAPERPEVLTGQVVDPAPAQPETALPEHGHGELLPTRPGQHRALDSSNHTLIVAPDGGYDDHGGYRGEPRPSRRYREPILQRWLFSRRLGYLAIGLALAGLLAWSGYWFFAGRYTNVPSVLGKTVAAARAELSRSGLAAADGRAQLSNTVPKGEIIKTMPGPGARLTHGSTVTMISSLGPKMISVPSVTGQQTQAAEAALTKAGLTYGRPTAETSSTIPAGIVITTNPVAGTRWPANKPVQLVVSAGPPLPDFVGQQESAAEGAAQSGGYSINPVPDTSSNEPQGTITKQSPAPNTVITPGEVVTVYVSQGPPMVPVPDVQGENVQQAIRQLKAAGFAVQVNQGLIGHRVTGYSPTGQAPRGSTITISVGLL